MSAQVAGPDKWRLLAERMAKLGIADADIEETFIRGSGSGGQKINKTSSCVILRHRPSGIVVRCQRERSQTMNRFLARRELCERIDERVRGAAFARRQAAEKIRRQKRRRSRRQKAVMLDGKRLQGAKKAARRTPSRDD